MYKEERDVFEEEVREIYECNMREFDTQDSSENTIAILGDRWWPQAARQEGDKISKTFLYGNNVVRAQLLEVSIRCRDGAPSRKGCVVYGHLAKANSK